jgi:hypothetical protein
MSATVRIAIAAAGAAVMLAAALDTAGQDQAKKREQVQQRTQERVQKREIIPGSELMTPQEREQYRQRMAGAKSDEERDRLRAEHYKAMDERARLRGLRLADPPPAAKGGTR